jgi:hypothetical protein
MIETAPSEIVREFLLSQLAVTIPNSGGSWPCFTASLPDGENAVDEAVCVYDDMPEKDGRLMSTSLVVLHYGIVVLLRSLDHSTGWQKINQIAGLLDLILHAPVTISSAEQFIIHNATRRSGVSSLGLESGTKRRFMFDTRYVITVSTI